MHSGWISRLFGGSAAAPSDTPAWAAELAEAVKRQARSQAKLAAQVEAMVDGLGRRVDALAARIEHARPAQAAPAGNAGTAALRWESLFDAIDLLEEACVAIGPNGGELARGLRGVLARLDAFAAEGGHERRAAVGLPLDGRCFRAVGTDSRPGLEDGVVTRLVRSAVLRHGQLIREGEVIINRKDP